MSAYRCPFYGYIMKNGPNYKLIRFCTSVSGRIQIRRPFKTASPAFCLFTIFAHFGYLVGGGSFGMENNHFSIAFLVQAYIPYVGAFSMAISAKERQVTAEGWSNVRFHGYSEEKRLLLAMTSYHQLR